MASVGNIDERRAFWQQAAKGMLDGKRQRISISIPERDLARLKTRAAEEGMKLKWFALNEPSVRQFRQTPELLHASVCG